MSNKSGVSSQVISMPTGGGAVRGIGETFSPDLFTGTGNFSVPIALPGGRNGLQPALRLTYSTGEGNGPFGLGWSIGVPGVARKTSRGVPRYFDTAENPSERDVFLLSGTEDLIAVDGRDGVTSFRPRTEGMFARIERTESATDDFWRVSTRDGLIGVYGTPGTRGADPTAVADPEDRSRVFAWRLSHTIDTFGNRIQYDYERDAGVDGPHRFDQLYLQRVSYVDHQHDGESRFLMTVTFIYEDRPDPSSDYRAGFEIRTRRRCKRIEMHTHPDEAVLVRRYELAYQDESDGSRNRQPLPRNGVSLLREIRITGHDGPRIEAHPPLTLSYTAFQPEERRFHPLAAANGQLPLTSLAADNLELVDLFGDGLPDIVQIDGGVVFWRNVGNGVFDGPHEMAEIPNGVQLKTPGVLMADLEGNGRADLLATPLGGYFPLTFAGRWSAQPVPYDDVPRFLEDPNVRLVDLDGDGIVDALRLANEVELFVNRGKSGWLPPDVRPPLEDFADLNFSDARVKLGDLNGDGLQDLIVINQGAVEYLPYFGHGRWGPRIRMDNSPVFEDSQPAPGLEFDPGRVLLGDVDCDGLDDIVHVEPDRITVWINQGGGSWSDPILIVDTPLLTHPDAVRLVDLFGTGTAGVLWSADATNPAEPAYHFLELTGGIKPYVLERVENNLGTVTHVQYAPSTRFFLADQADQRTTWQTHLPFPVQVVERVEVIDELSNGKLTTEFRYHHGYWDGGEREFRGFGMVEKTDTETFERFNAAGLHGAAAMFSPIDREQFSPPALTRTWFHLGAIDDEEAEHPELDLSHEFFADDVPLLTRPPEMAALLAALPRQDRADALRSLRSTVLRTELYRGDDPGRPFTVTESLSGLREEALLPPGSPARRRIFFPHALAQRVTSWERGDDPMTRFTFTDDYDDVGQPRRRTAIACPRGWRSLADRPAQPYLATQTRSEFATAVSDSGVYMTDRMARSTSFEIANDGSQTLFELKNDADAGSALEVIDQTFNFYDGPAFVGLPLGQIGGHGALVRSESLVMTSEMLKEVYRADTMASATAEIPPYLNPDGPPSWTSEYPDEFRAHVAGLPHLAGYSFNAGDESHEAGYFVTSIRNAFDFQLRNQPHARGLLKVVRDPLGDELGRHDSIIEYDGFDLFPIKVTDPAGLVTQAAYDRRLQAIEAIDPNGNRTHYGYTPLGLVETIAVLGKQGEFAGDEVQGSDGIRPSTRFEYDLLAFANSRPGQRVPASIRTIRLVHHAGETDVNDDRERQKTVETVEYSDGFGRLLQTRMLAEDDTVGHTTFGGGMLPADQSVDPGTIVLRARSIGAEVNVVVSGAQRYDNKGRVVEVFEPYFELESGFAYRPPSEDQLGRPVTTFYDPLGRAIRTMNADGSEQRVVHGVPGSIEKPDVTTPDIFEPTPWEAYTYDGNDLAPLSREPKSGGTPGLLLTNSAPRHHHFTPSSALVDPLGRAILTVARNREAPERADGPLPPLEEIATRSTYDIRGNVLKLIDGRRREAFTYAYDLAGHTLRIESIDAGVRRIVLDGAGKELERRDSKGAVVLHGYDRLQRATRLWARDADAREVTLRERLEYGDGGDPDQAETARNENLALNRLGVLHRHYDEAGLLEIGAYDFKGNILRKNRRVVRDEAILASVHRRDEPDRTVRAFVVNWDPLEEQQNSLLETQPFEVLTTYDGLNRVKRLLHPTDVNGGRKELRPAYNRAGALERLLLDDEPFVEHVAYDAKGQRTFVAFGSHVMTLYAYDPRTFRPSRMFSTRFLKNDGRTFRPASLSSPEARKKNLHQDVAYDYDLAGNILRIRDRTPESGILNSLLGRDALNRTFEYDALYRLTRATGREVDRPPWQTLDAPFDPRPRGTDVTKARAYDQHYRYDVLGNLERLRHVAVAGGFTRTFTTVPESNRLDTLNIGNGTSTTFRYRHDDNGNLTGETAERHFEWDHSDRMKIFRTQVDGSDPSIHAHYLYAAGGQRMKKIVRKQNGLIEITDYIDGMFERHRWQENSREFKANNRYHLMDGGQRFATVGVGDRHPEDQGPNVQFHLGDHLGSSSVVTGVDGGPVNTEEYTPYGETSFGSFGLKRYRFNGRERDEEHGLCYHGFRYYAPWLARWSAADPAGSSDGVNLYAYCHGNPVVLRDSLGLQARDYQDHPTPGTTAMNDGVAVGVYNGTGGIDLYESETIEIEGHVPAAATLPLPEIDHSLEVAPGAVYQAYSEAKEAAGNSNNSWWQRGISFGLATCALPLAWVEEYVARPVANIPYYADVGGQYIARGTLQDNPYDAISDVSEGIGNLASGFNAAASVLAPLAGGGAAPGISSTSGAAGAAEAPFVGTGTRAAYRMDVARKIQGTPLEPYLLENGSLKKFPQRTHSSLIDRPDLVEASHYASNKIGGNQLILESAWDNQIKGLTIERPSKGGAVLTTPYVDIYGVAVSLDTARWWDRLGWPLPPGWADNVFH